MYRYNPRKSPDPEMWLSIDEQERIDLVERFHRSERIHLPNIKMHAIFHAIIENQIAEQHDPVVRAMARLATEGLSRHECIHAIAWVLAHEFYGEKKSTARDAKVNAQARYDSAIERFSAVSWRAQAASDVE